MARFKQFQPHKNNDTNHRWLVSYADYMTLMFALFVVMYAMATVQNKEFKAFSDTISNVFNRSVVEIEKPSHGLFAENQAHTIAEPPNVAQPKLGDSAQVMDISYALSDVALKQQGQTLESLQQALKNVLSHEIEQGYVVIEQDMDWLTIELSSSLMFISGSGVPTTRAKNVLQSLLPILNTNRNFIRTRGYTDDLPINNELFRSNWHLSVARATEVLVLLESLGVNPARMATEGYGQYAPFSDNSDELSRQQNRKVVIAISKYALPQEKIKKTNNQQQKQQKTQVKRDNTIKVIELENGGILITTREQQ